MQYFSGRKFPVIVKLIVPILLVLFFIGFISKGFIYTSLQNFIQLAQIRTQCEAKIYHNDTWFCFESSVPDSELTINPSAIVDLLNRIEYQSEFKIVTVELTNEVQNGYQLIYGGIDSVSESYGLATNESTKPKFKIQVDLDNFTSETNSNSHKISRLFARAMYQTLHQGLTDQEVTEALTTVIILISSLPESELPLTVE